MKLGFTQSATHAGQSNNDLWPAISAHAGSTSPLHPEMNSCGYFMEWNRTLGKKKPAL